MNTSDWYFIINPVAGNGRAKKRWSALSRALDEVGIVHQSAFSKEKGHATQLAMTAIEQGFRNIAALGGDGTNNEVINGIVQQNVVSSTEISYALLPFGTGNDWSRTYRLPKKNDAFIQMLIQKKTTLQDIGQVDYDLNDAPKKRYFANVAGMAYDAFIVETLQKEDSVNVGKLRYLYLIFSCLRKYSPLRGKVFFDEKIDEDDYYLVNVGICKYSGGGMQFVPHAIPDDGQLALTIARNVSAWGIVKATPLFYNGKCGDHPKVELYHAQSIRVESQSNEPILLEVDGEFLGGTPVEFSVIPKAIQVVIP